MLTRAESAILSDKDFKFICQFVYETSGIVLNDSKREMVYRRLTRIIREKSLPSFAHYCQLLRSQPELETNYFINAITTNLTSFFREKHHFDFLHQVELPRLMQEKKERRLRIWSSACSTGEEPYSIAMTLLDTVADKLSSWDMKILATDIDSNVLERAKQGIYKGEDENLTKHHRIRYFQKGTGVNSDKFRVQDHVRELITFKQLNLLHGWPMKGLFDVVFCRNVLIYFDKNTQHELFQRYYDILTPNGVLMLGHSENLGRFQQYFQPIGRTMFRKLG